MRRRALLTSIGGGIPLLMAGCLNDIRDTTEPVHFELWNKTDTAHQIEVTIRELDQAVVLDRTYDIKDATNGPPGGNVIRESGITEATNGTQFDAVATLNQTVNAKHTFQVLCNDREPENVFIIEIEPGKEPSITFNQSSCS